jgi:hypothetical protein
MEMKGERGGEKASKTTTITVHVMNGEKRKKT